MKVGDIVKIKDNPRNAICIVVRRCSDGRSFRIKGINNGRDYEVRTGSKYWEVVSESRRFGKS